MKSGFILVLLLSLFAFPITAGDQNSEAKLKIEAQPRQGFTPLLVTLHATLEGVKLNDKDFYCLKQEWDFGDGSVSTEEPNCEPFSAETKIETEFFAQHEYEDAGTYQAFFTLGDKKVVSRKYQINVIFSQRGGRAFAKITEANSGAAR